jgi:signal transduction histidine kinase
MMDENPQPDAQEISGVLNRVNRLGTVTERLFSRLYTGLSHRSRLEEAARQQAEMQAARETAARLGLQNQHLQKTLETREVEIERLNGVLAKIDEGLIMQDQEGRIVLINRAARELLGSQKNFWESELGTLFEAYREFTQVDAELTPLGEPTQIQVNGRIVGGQLAAVADNQGNRLGTLIVLRDVTQEALSERLKNQFVLGISHELKTPMTVIKGMSELLAGQSEDQPANRSFLEKLTRNVDILNGMVVELLDLSEMGAGSFSIRQDDLDFEPIIWSVVNGKMPDLKRAKLDVAVMTRDIRRLKVKGDDERLRWALGHLIQNSARYSEPGGDIVVSSGLNHEGHVIIRVADTGVGIMEKDLPHIFERFYRGEPRTPEGKLLDPRGLGQGLFVARTVSEAHGGYLSVESRVHQGSVFTMVLPALSA